MIEAFYQAILNEASSAYACFRIVGGDGSEPADLILLEASTRFGHQFNTRFSSVGGRRAKELWPDADGLADLLLNAALAGKPADFDLRPPQTRESCRLHVFFPDPQYLFLVCRTMASEPIPDADRQTGVGAKTRLLSDLGQEFLWNAADSEQTAGRLTDTLREVAGARYTALLLADQASDRPGFRTAALSGISESSQTALRDIGINLSNKFWDIPPEKVHRLTDNQLRAFPDAAALLRNLYPTAAVLVDGLKGIGEAALLPCAGADATLTGFYLLLMPEGKPLQDSNGALALFSVLSSWSLDRFGTARPDESGPSDEHPAPQFLEALLDHSPGALFLIRSEDGVFRYDRVNRKALPLFGRESIGSVCGHTPEEVLGPERGKTAIRYLSECLSAETDVTYEEILTLAGDTTCWRTTLTALPGSGRIRWLLASATDMTRLRLPSLSPQTAAQRNEFLLDLLDHSRNFTDFLRLVMTRVLWLTASTGGAVLLFERSTNTLVPVYETGMDDPLLQQAPSSGILLEDAGVWAEPIHSGQPCFQLSSEDGPIPQAGNMLLLPIREYGDVAAVVGMRNKREAYTQEDALRATQLLDSVWDAAERLHCADRNRRERDLMRAALSGINEAVLASGEDGRIVWMNEAAAGLTGWTVSQAMGRELDNVLKLLDEHSRVPLDLSTVHTPQPDADNPSPDIFLVSRNGETVPVSIFTATLAAEETCPACTVWTLRDLSDERQRQENISYLSYHDPLTGMYNRRFFEEELRRLDTRRNLPITLVMSDVNGLKLVNDAFGHAMGDRLLRKAADVFREGCREDDIIARLGGDEYVILLPHASSMEAEAVITRIREQAARTKVGTVTLSVSFGWETKTDPDDDMSEILRRAEDRMYRQKLFESPSMRNSTVKAILQALYETHPMEQAHSHRVARLCERIGRALSLPEHEIKELHTAGLLHDIGKIAINSEIIIKEEPLTDEDRWEIRKHAEIGYRILSSVNELAEIADFVLLHHERWDGAGYPKGLKGTAIPLASRIIGLADCYNAMTSDRPYRSALPEDEAIASIQREAGTKFDPDLVRLFVTQVARREFAAD